MAKTILIIDDEPDIRDYLTAVLEDHGYVTHVVNENQSIPEAVTACRPDLIILDLMMPDRSGILVYKELRSTPETARIPVALLTGLDSNAVYSGTGVTEYMEKESIPPPDRFIDKPINIPDLLSSIQSLFGERRDSSDAPP